MGMNEKSGDYSKQWRCSVQPDVVVIIVVVLYLRHAFGSRELREGSGQYGREGD